MTLQIERLCTIKQLWAIEPVFSLTDPPRKRVRTPVQPLLLVDGPPHHQPHADGAGNLNARICRYSSFSLTDRHASAMILQALLALSRISSERQTALKSRRNRQHVVG